MPQAYEGVPQKPTHRDAIINAFVFVHLTLHQANQRLQKRGGRVMAITPRHYLDFINHFVSSTFTLPQVLDSQKGLNLPHKPSNLDCGLKSRWNECSLPPVRVQSKVLLDLNLDAY